MRIAKWGPRVIPTRSRLPAPTSKPPPSEWCGQAIGRIRPRRKSQTTQSCSTCWRSGCRTLLRGPLFWCRTRESFTAFPRRRELLSDSNTWWSLNERGGSAIIGGHAGSRHVGCWPLNAPQRAHCTIGNCSAVKSGTAARAIWLGLIALVTFNHDIERHAGGGHDRASECDRWRYVRNTQHAHFLGVLVISPKEIA